MVDDDFLQALALVESSPNHRVLRRFVPRDSYNEWRGDKLYRALFLDLETTGLDTKTAEVIEFAGARFTFDANGVVYDIEDEYQSYQQPSAPIEPEITEINGITDADVQGTSISAARMVELLAGVDLVIAYNADFDRRIAERVFPGLFETLKWACAYRQVKWEKYGAVGRKLEHIMTAAGLFFDGHRALIDARAGIHLLATLYQHDPSPLTTPMTELLATTKAGAIRVLAHDAAFEWKDRMKARGYQWRGSPPWFIDTGSTDEATAEARWLVANAGGSPAFQRITARDRYSIREDTAA